MNSPLPNEWLFQTNGSSKRMTHQTNGSPKRIASKRIALEPLPNEWLLKLQPIRLSFSFVWTEAVTSAIRLNTLFCTFQSEIFNTSNLMMKPLAIGAKINTEQNLTFNFTFWSGFVVRTWKHRSHQTWTETWRFDTNHERRLSNQLLDRLDR